MTNNFTAAELQTLHQLESQYDVQALANQLQTVITTGDPIRYMESNINWEAEKQTNEQPMRHMDSIERFILPLNGAKADFNSWHPFRRFIDWFKRSLTSKKVKKALCDIAEKIQKLIDAKAELSELIKLGLVTLAAVAGLVINPVVLTIMVGLLAMMIIEGINNTCGI